MNRRRALLLVAAVALCACRRFDAPIERDLAAEDGWTELDAIRDRRLALAGSLVNAAKASAARDEPAVSEAAEARASANLRMTGADLADPLKVAALLRAEDALGAALGRLLALRARYPGLWADGATKDAEAQLGALDRELARAREAYDAAARAYDEEIATLPRHAVNKLTGKRFLPRVILATVPGR